MKNKTNNQYDPRNMSQQNDYVEDQGRDNLGLKIFVAIAILLTLPLAGLGVKAMVSDDTLEKLNTMLEKSVIAHKNSVESEEKAKVSYEAAVKTRESNDVTMCASYLAIVAHKRSKGIKLDKDPSETSEVFCPKKMDQVTEVQSQQ